MKRKRKRPPTQAEAEKEIAEFLQWAHEQGWTLDRRLDTGTLVFKNVAGEEKLHPPLLVEFSVAVARGYKPVNKEFLRLAADDVAKRFPDNWGFILIAAPHGEGGRTTYTSNIARPEAIKLLKEFLFRIGEAEDWMKHVE